MSLVNKIKKLCDEKGMTFASLERELKFGNGTTLLLREISLLRLLIFLMYLSIIY